MIDRISEEHRSWNMSRIRAKDTKPELEVRSLLHRLGFRFRLHRIDLPGTPDIVLSKYRAAVFVNGCFWHRHAGCKYAYTPKSNIDFWENKFSRTIERDKENISKLEASNWHVIIVWECEIADLEALGARLRNSIVNSAHQ